MACRSALTRRDDPVDQYVLARATSARGRPLSAAVTACRYAGSPTVLVALRYSTTTSASFRPNTWLAWSASRWLWLAGGVKLFPEDSLPNTPVPQTAANATSTSAMPRVSRRLVYKARPHASNIPVSSVYRPSFC